MKIDAHKLYTAKFVSEVFGWMSAWAVNNRIKNGHQKIVHESSGQGIPNMFYLSEVVHAAVVDEFSSLGVFGNQIKSSIHYAKPYIDENSKPRFRIEGGRAEKPTTVEPGYYEDFDYRVIIEIEIRHDKLPGSNIPKEDREGPGRFCVVTYAPEEYEGRSFMYERLDYWRDPNKIKHNKFVTAKSYIKVRPFYEMVLDKLS